MYNSGLMREWASTASIDLNISLRQVLVISYTFPPVGGAGVQRVTKFVKYLREHGWQPTVLTVANPSVPVLDHSLSVDVPKGTPIHTATSWEPSYGLKSQATSSASDSATSAGGIKRGLLKLAGKVAKSLLQPDPQILWYPSAVREGKRLLKEKAFDAVFATAPPFSTFLIASKLARAGRLPLVIDYRDEWSISNAYWENKDLGLLSRSVQSRMQNSILRAASAVIATTELSAQALRKSCDEARSRAAVSWIYNGFDSDDFQKHINPTAKNGFYRLVYTGTLWNLTSVAPLVESIRHLSRESPKTAAKIELVFAGRRVGNQAKLVESLRDFPCRLETHEYLDHSAAIELTRSADANCVILSDIPGAERVVPAKLFEYMASQRPILGLLPQGESWNLLDKYSHAYRFEPSDHVGIAKWLANSVQNHALHDAVSLADPPPVCFDRNHQAGQLAEILNRCCPSRATIS